jgi:DNA-binding XRE family transcriptional regulator
MSEVTMSDFDNLMLQIEEEAAARGPEGVAELNELRARFQLARELRAARKDAGLTQQRLAEETGIGQAEISKIENGDANATIATLAQLGTTLQLDLHFLRRGDHGPIAV